MKRHLHLIALRTVKYSDRHNILIAYSRECGRVAFAIPAGAGREASRRRALLMPLGLVECVADIRPGQDVLLMHEPRAGMALHGIHAHPVKSAVALFLAEVLAVVLREGPADETLYEYVSRSVAMLDSIRADRVANFHLCFLYGLGRHLGIEPDMDGYRPGTVFDMVDGCFRMSAPMHRHYLPSTEAAAVAALSRMTYVNMHRFRMSRHERNNLLDGILRYYSLHYTALGSLKSLDVLRVLF